MRHLRFCIILERALRPIYLKQQGYGSSLPRSARNLKIGPNLLSPLTYACQTVVRERLDLLLKSDAIVLNRQLQFLILHHQRDTNGAGPCMPHCIQHRFGSNAKKLILDFWTVSKRYRLQLKAQLALFPDYLARSLR